MRWRYVALEGIDGSGKDTQIALLASRLDGVGITPIVLHEPSHGEHGRALRALMAALSADVARQRELFTRDRIDHVRRKIGPALELVRAQPAFALLQNRSLFSAAAYQPYGEADDDLRRTIDEQAAIAPLPELTVILDVDVATAMARLEDRGRRDALEREDVLARVRGRYLRLAELYPTCVLVDASGCPKAVAEAVAAAVGAPH